MSKHEFLNIRIPIEKDNPSIQRHEELCIKCGQCRRVCENDIAVGRLYDIESTGDTAICINCGQCADVCPANSITEVYEYEKVREAIKDPKKIVIFSTSPSVRVALGEEFNLPAGSFVEGQMVAALRALGADYVLDVDFAADLTIMEEASELIERITKKTKPLPQFTSCCPAWVKFAEVFYPSILPNISSVKSPIGMQSVTIKTYFAKAKGINPRDIVNVTVTPCTAKKFEIRRPEMNASASYNNIPELRDMDHIITTRELAKWMKEDNISFNSLVPSKYDKLMGEASGGGIIFGNTGGVMEAALRTAYYFITNENPPEKLLDLTPVRGLEDIREATVSIGDLSLKVAIVHGTDNAKTLIDKLNASEVSYDFVEVMTCRGGCIGGGGQPKSAIPMVDNIRSKRIHALYNRDEHKSIRSSYENPDIKRVYEEFYGEPLSDLAKELLHTTYTDRSDTLGSKGMVCERLSSYAPTINNDVSTSISKDDNNGSKKNYKCSICGYIYVGDEIPDDYKCPICGASKEAFVLLDDKNSTEDTTSDEDNNSNKTKKSYRCSICGYIYVGDEIPNDYTCPVCGASKDAFALLEDNNSTKDNNYNKDTASSETKKSYKCSVCGYIYVGDEIPDNYTCPVCGSSKEVFIPIEE
ncbi:hypothetical protein UT300003_24090 [Clostridium sardiniense]